jgi:hypothetical protein
MPEIISKYKIFLASPSDLLEERESINQVISELNQTFGNPNNIVLELLKWESNSAPACGANDVQSIINNDIQEYDLFIGLLWMKFGTPTQKYGSGTEEEFNIAHQKFLKDNNSIQILLYFKNSVPQSLSEINPEQLIKVREFKAGLGEKNVLYWEFNLKDELERLLRIHIPKRIQNLKSNFNNSEKNTAISTEIVIIEAEEEFGILDYQEFIEDSFSISTHALLRISEAINWIGDEMNKKTTEIESLVAKNRNQQISFKVQRNLLERTSNVMIDFANRVEPEIPIYINNFEKGIDSFSKLVTIYINDFENKDNEIKEAIDSLDNLLVQIEFALNNMNDFLVTVDSLPKMSKELNSARKKVAHILTEFSKKLEVSVLLGKEVNKNISS